MFNKYFIFYIIVGISRKEFNKCFYFYMQNPNDSKLPEKIFHRYVIYNLTIMFLTIMLACCYISIKPSKSLSTFCLLTSLVCFSQTVLISLVSDVCFNPRSRTILMLCINKFKLLDDDIKYIVTFILYLLILLHIQLLIFFAYYTILFKIIWNEIPYPSLISDYFYFIFKIFIKILKIK